jgi:hypothetical protein
MGLKREGQGTRTHGRPQTFFQGGAKTYFLPKKHQKTYYFSKKSPKTYYFWLALAGQGERGGKRPPLPSPLRMPMQVQVSHAIHGGYVP